MPDRFAFQQLDDGWDIDFVWKEGDYKGGPVSLWIRPVDPEKPPPGGLSSTVLRNIDFREAKDGLLKSLERDPHGWRGSPEKQNQREQERLERLSHQLARGIIPEYLALLSSEYIQRVQNGQPKPVERLAADLGIPLQTLRGHLWRARKQGLLEGSPGRKGGTLSTEAMTILQRMPRPEKSRKPPKASLIYDDPPAGMEEGGSADR